MSHIDRALSWSRHNHAMLWAATLTGMAASWIHLAQFLGWFEADAYRWVGGLGATAVDLGILACMREVARGRHARAARQTVIGLCIVSACANAEHAVGSWLVGHPNPARLEWAWLVFNAAIVSGTLPVIVYRLSGLLDATKTRAVADEADADAQPAKAKRTRKTAVGSAVEYLKLYPAYTPNDIAPLVGLHPSSVRRQLANAGYRKNGNGHWTAA